MRARAGWPDAVHSRGLARPIAVQSPETVRLDRKGRCGTVPPTGQPDRSPPKTVKLVRMPGPRPSGRGISSDNRMASLKTEDRLATTSPIRSRATLGPGRTRVPLPNAVSPTATERMLSASAPASQRPRAIDVPPDLPPGGRFVVGASARGAQSKARLGIPSSPSRTRTRTPQLRRKSRTSSDPSCRPPAETTSAIPALAMSFAQAKHGTTVQ